MKYFYIGVIAVYLLVFSSCSKNESFLEEHFALTPYASSSDIFYETAEYTSDHISISLQIPVNWSYETVPLTDDRCGIELWRNDAPDIRMGMYYYTSFPGLCGMGVTIEDREFSSGHTAKSYFENLGDVCYSYVIFKDTPGDYVFEALYVPTDFWEENQSWISAILSTVIVGEGELTESEALTIAEAECPEKRTTGRKTFDHVTGQWTVYFYNPPSPDPYVVTIASDGSIIT